MTAIHQAAGPRATALAAPSKQPPRALAGSPTALLPPPATSSLSNVEDGLLVMLALQGHASQDAAKIAQAEARSTNTKNTEQFQKVCKAIDEQREAERASHGFWAKFKKIAGTIAKIGAIVAAVAGTIVTGGAAAPLALGIAAVALSAGGLAIREFKLLGKDSDKIAMGMEIAGAVCSAGAGLASVAASGAATASAGTTAAAAAGSKTASAVELGADVTAGAATVGSGLATMRLAQFQADADHAAADEADARGKQQMYQDHMKRVVNAMQEAEEEVKEAIDATTAAIQSCSNAADAAANGVLRA